MVSKILRRATYFASALTIGLIVGSLGAYDSYRSRTRGSVTQTHDPRWGYRCQLKVEDRDGIRLVKVYTSMEPEAYSLYYPAEYWPGQPKEGLPKVIKGFVVTRGEPAICADVTDGNNNVERLSVD